MSQAINLDTPALRRVLATIASAKVPFTVRELGERAHVDLENLRSRVVPALVRAGYLHAVGWRAVAMGRRPTEYLPGPGTPPPRPAFCKLTAARQWKQAHNYNALQSERQRRKRAVDRTARIVATAPNAMVGLLMLGSKS